MYLNHYSLESKPFQMSTDPDFLWFGEKHKEALATLKYAIVENKGILALTGDVGTGKTTLINALVQSLGDDTMVATIYDPSLEVMDFFNIVSVAFNMERTFDSKGEFLIYFKRFLKKVRERNKKVLMIIDEAQRISSELLEEVRLLSNLEDEHIRLLNIFFVGQNEFVDTLKEYKNRALRQRITIRYHIEPLTLSETGAYIRHRLKTAGASRPIFTVDAIHEIFSFSKGYPRMINIICDHALLSGYVRGIRDIEKDVIRECKEELKISTSTSGFLPYNSKPESGVRPDAPSTSSFHRYTSDHESEFKREAPFVQGSPVQQEVPVIQREGKPKNSNIRLILAVICMGILAVIGGFTGYVFYNNVKTKTDSRTSLLLGSGKTSYAGQNDLRTSDPTVPEKHTSPVASKVEIGQVGDSRYYIVKDPEPKLYREIETSKEETPSSVPSEAIAGQADTQEIPGRGREVEVYDAFTKIVPKESKIAQISPEETKSTPPEAKPITVQKETLNKDRTEPAPSAKPASRVTDGFSDSIQKPAVSDISKMDKQSVKIPEIPESMSTGVKVPTKKPQKMMAAVLTTESEEKKVVPNVEQKVVAPYRKKIKSEGSLGSDFVYTDLQFRLDDFLDKYCWTYEKKQVDRFAALFTPDAMENGQLFTSRLGQYRRNFERIDAMEYRIELKRYAIQEGTGAIRIEGIFHARARLDGSKKWRKNSGTITMELVARGDSFKVKRLDY